MNRYDMQIQSIKENFGGNRTHMAFRQIAGSVKARTVTQIENAATRQGVKVELRPATELHRFNAYVALPLNGVTGFKR